MGGEQEEVDEEDDGEGKVIAAMGEGKGQRVERGRKE